ncbi:hypothetical protein Tco_0641280 [Tanacetum coccineum]
MLRRNIGDSLRRKRCDDSFLCWSMLRRNPSGILHRKVPWALHFGAVLIMQMLYYFVNNIHVVYAKLLWEGFHYSLRNPRTMIPYLRFTKLIVSHYMTTFPKISRRAYDRYHNLADDVMIKSIFNLGKSKDVVGMKIINWMITDEMKLMENYRLYA